MFSCHTDLYIVWRDMAKFQTNTTQIARSILELDQKIFGGMRKKEKRVVEDQKRKDGWTVKKIIITDRKDNKRRSMEREERFMGVVSK